MIARESTAATYPEEQAEQAVKALAAVRKVLDDKDTPEDISMDELVKAGVSSDVYLCGLKMCSKGNCCHAKKTIRVLDQHVQSRCHRGVESKHGFAVHP